MTNGTFRPKETLKRFPRRWMPQPVEGTWNVGHAVVPVSLPGVLVSWWFILVLSRLLVTNGST